MSLKAIAKELGLSVTTVSRALNGYDDVSRETRARVEAEAQRRGYRPNTFARRLKMGKIDAVGLVFPVHPVPLNNSAGVGYSAGALCYPTAAALCGAFRPA
jgi:LacI family transcriptional regulator